MPSTARLLIVLFLVASVPQGAPAKEVGYDTILALQSADENERRSAKKALVKANDSSLIPGLIDSMFFTATEQRGELMEVLEKLTGEQPGPRYYDWVEWLGAHPEIEPRDGYADFKVRLLQRIDKKYAQIIYPKAPTRIRLEEVVWGGVRVGGIPALVSPASIPAAQAEYLEDEELVFGVSLNGEDRAYPLRFMDWHEMLNDAVGGEPFALSYCTLCRSGILYSTRTPNGAIRTFGTSGLLYRSNKLMIDQESLTLWSNLTGEPVVGRLAGTETRLQVLPMTLTTWREWVTRHPDTTVLDLEALRDQFAFLYSPGAADESRQGVSFPVWQKDQRLDSKAEVYTLRLDGQAKAYVVDAVVVAGIVNDQVGTIPVVLIAEPGSGAIRVYLRGESQQFNLDPQGRLVDQTGTIWQLGEEALEAGEGAGLSTRLERQPGHVAFWFGWYGFYPDTELWQGPTG